MDVQVWVTPINEDEARAKQITNGTWDGVAGITWARDGRIVFMRAIGEQVDLWTTNPDGSQQKQITSDNFIENHPATSPDGRYIVFDSSHNGKKLWRTDADGTNPKQLTDGTFFEAFPVISADSQFVFFNTNRSGAIELWKVGIDGGAPVKLSDMFAAYPDVSPDGKLIVVFHVDEQNHNLMQLLVFSTDGGPPVKTINLPNTAGPFQGGPRWLPDGRSVALDIQLCGFARRPPPGIITRGSIPGHRADQRFSLKTVFGRSGPRSVAYSGFVPGSD